MRKFNALETDRIIQAINNLAGARTENQAQVLIEILAELKKLNAAQSAPTNAPITLSDLIDSVTVKSILAIGDSTLYRIKKSKIVQTVRIGKRDYYSLTEINSIIPHYKK